MSRLLLPLSVARMYGKCMGVYCDRGTENSFN